MTLTATLLGVLIGAALGLLGGGGSILTVPIFVYVLGYGAKDAVAMSLAVVGITSLVGAVAHWRAAHVDLGAAALFGGAGMLGTWTGSRAAALVSGQVQMLVFAVVMLGAAILMVRRRPRIDEHAAVAGTRSARAIGVMLGSGVLVGLLTGLVGVGGGFLIVPALVLGGLPIRPAIGTSLLVIAANCAAGFAGYLGQVTLNWTSVGLVTAGTLPGIAGGTFAAQFVSQPMLRRAFATFLVLMAAFILYEHAAVVVSAVR